MSVRASLFFALFLITQPCSIQAANWPEKSKLGEGFGVQIKAELVTPESLADISSLGFKYVRFSLGWDSVEASKNIQDWSETDRLIQMVRRSGLKMVIPVHGGNPVYEGFVPAPKKNTDHVQERPKAPSLPETVEAFARFMTQAVLRYGTDDILWEIWNEPDLGRFWPPKADEQTYSVLVSRTCNMVRQYAPGARIVGLSLARVPDGYDQYKPDFLFHFLKSSGARCLDGFTVHPYRRGREEPEAVYGDYALLNSFLAKTQHYVPLLNSEIGYTGMQVSEEDQANYVMRSRLIDLIWGVPLTIWYEWQDSRDDLTDPESQFGLLRRNGESKPALEAVRSVLGPLKDYLFEQQIHTTNPKDMLVALRNGNGDRAIVGWTLRTDKDREAMAYISEEKKVVRKVPLTARPSILFRTREEELAVEIK